MSSTAINVTFTSELWPSGYRAGEMIARQWMNVNSNLTVSLGDDSFSSYFRPWAKQTQRQHVWILLSQISYTFCNKWSKLPFTAGPTGGHRRLGVCGSCVFFSLVSIKNEGDFWVVTLLVHVKSLHVFMLWPHVREERRRQTANYI